MTVGGGFRRVARILRHVERNGWRIVTVRTREDRGLWSGSAIHLRISCSRTEGEATDECPTTLTEEFGEFDSCDARLHEVRDIEPGRIVAEYDIDVDTPDGGDDGDASTDDRPQTPLHRDRRRLVRLYREEETFTAMAESVTEDVSPETIRRYTIEHGIHTPNGDSSDGDESPVEDETERGISSTHPPRVDPEEIITTVERANTLYEVQRAFALDRKETVELLRQYDVLDLVIGRLDRDDDPDSRRETIRRRLRNAGDHETPVVAGRNR